MLSTPLSNLGVANALLNPFVILPKGASSVSPIPKPLSEAEPRSSSVAPYARARSLASPAPAPPATTPAKGNAAGPARAAGANAAIEPMPADNLYSIESWSPPLRTSISVSYTHLTLPTIYSV